MAAEDKNTQLTLFQARFCLPLRSVIEIKTEFTFFV